MTEALDHWHATNALKERFLRCQRRETEGDIASSFASALIGFECSLENQCFRSKTCRCMSWPYKFHNLAVRRAAKAKADFTKSLQDDLSQRLKSFLKRRMSVERDYRYLLMAADCLLALGCMIQFTKVLQAALSLQKTKHCDFEASWSVILQRLRHKIPSDGSTYATELKTMPIELTLTIFRYLRKTDVLKCRQVCKQWRDIIDNARLPYRNLTIRLHDSMSSSLKKCERSGIAGPETLSYESPIKGAMKVPRFDLFRAARPLTLRWNALQCLDLILQNQDDNMSTAFNLDLNSLPSFESLRVLRVCAVFESLANPPSTAATCHLVLSGDMKAITPRLHSLAVRVENDGNRKWIADATKLILNQDLSVLEICMSATIVVNDLQRMLDTNVLKKLTLENVGNSSDTSHTPRFPNQTNLESLTLSAKYLDGLTHLGGIISSQKSITHASLSSGPLISKTVIFDPLQCLVESAASLCSLEYLIPSLDHGINITSVLKVANNLSTLSVASQDFLDEGTEPYLAKLQYLKVMKCPSVITGAFCRFVQRRIHHLRRIDLEACDVSEDALQWLRNCSQIQFRYIPRKAERIAIRKGRGSRLLDGIA